MAPTPATALKGLGLPRLPFIVVDPGRTTGWAVWERGEYASESTVLLDELPGTLRSAIRALRPAFVVCEDFHLVGSQRRSAGATEMPAARGIGICWCACEWSDVPLYLVQPNCKSAGRAALDAAGRDAHERCRNDHERDVIDIAGYVLRQLQLPGDKA